MHLHTITRTVTKFAIPVSVGTVNTNAKFVTNANTKTRAWEPGTILATNVIVTDLGANEAVKSEGYAAVPGGIMIQLPSSIGTNRTCYYRIQTERCIRCN